MAKYEDYAKQDEALDQEIDQASQESADRQAAGESGFEVPERFKGKTAEDIARSYAELEQAYSRQGNDLGRMRQVMDEYLENLQSHGSSQTASPSQEEEAKPVTIDDLYDNADEAIRRAVESMAGSKIATLEQELAKAKLETRVQALDEKYEGWRDEVKTPEFQNWVAQSPYRQRLASAADGWDLDAAEDLLGLYNEVRGVRDVKDQAQRDAALQAGTLESGAASVPAQEETYSRTKLTEMRVKSMQGDPEARKWLVQNGEAIAIAYEKGNITD